MTVDFATPIAHQTGSDYSAFNNALTKGRSFRQPLETAPNPNNFSAGLEMFLSATGPVANIYALFDGNLHWQASTTNEPGHRLILKRNFKFPSLNIIEGPPTEVIYENVDHTEVQHKLEALLNAAYTASTGSNTANWHPAMKEMVRVGGQKKRLRLHLDPSSSAPDKITQWITGFLAGTGPLQKIPVKAGDLIGRVAPYLPTDPLPTNPPFALGAANDANRARRLTFRMYDNCKQTINPLYYLHAFMRQMLLSQANRKLNSLTNIVSGGSLAHSLITLYGELGAGVGPRSREFVDGQSRIPLGDLANFHGYPSDSPISTRQWRYTNNLEFEVNAATPSMRPGANQNNRVNTIWNHAQYGGDAIATICEIFQIPCELIVAFVCHESAGRTERVMRLEPLKSQQRNQIQANPAAAPLEMAYDLLTATHGTLAAGDILNNGNGTSTIRVTLDHGRQYRPNFIRKIGGVVVNDDRRFIIESHSSSSTQTQNYTFTVHNQGPTNNVLPVAGDIWITEGYATDVPDLWPGANRVFATRSTLTWDQLVTIVDATNGQRISPGLIQTLIATARSTLTWINATVPTIFTTLGISPPPANAGAFLGPPNHWLLHGVHSLVVGAAYLRKRGYNECSTCFDLPLVASAYNTGKITTKKNSQWGVSTAGDYTESSGRFWNAAAVKFNTDPGLAHPPSIRFMR